MLINWLLKGRRWGWGYAGLVLAGLGLGGLLKLGELGFDLTLLHGVVFGVVLLISVGPTLVFSLAGILPLKLPAVPLPGHEPVPRTRFLIIIPAFNEARVIRNPLQSLLVQRSELAEVRIVAAFNGTDDTGRIASELGVEVISTPTPGCGKSNAIAYVLAQIEPDPQRYVLILDADNVVGAGFLDALARASRSGAVAMQANHKVLLSKRNWVSLGLLSGYASSSRLYNAGRSRLLGSALLCGTGFAIQEAVFRGLWPHVRTQTEDIEMNGLLTLHHGAGVQWVQQASFFDEKPDTVVVAIRQRVRWMVGHFRCMWFYSWPLFVHGLRQRSLRSLELSLYYMVPVAILMAACWMLLVWPAALVAQLPAHGLSADMGLGLSALILAYILGLPAMGHALEIQRISIGRLLRIALFSVYAAAVALAVWPLAIIMATMMLTRTDWIFHTPHHGSGNTGASG